MAVGPGIERLECERGSVVVCVAVAAVDERAIAGVRSVLEYSDPSVPVLLAGPADSLRRLFSEELHVEARSGGVLKVVTEGSSLSVAFNRAVEACPPADVVLVAPGVVVTSEWLSCLHAAATDDSIVASATPLSLGGGGVELFAMDRSGGAGRSDDDVVRGAIVGAPLDPSETAESLAYKVRARALRLYPRIATMGSGCVYLRRQAWELAGPLRSDLTLECALDGVARRAIALGMINVVADDLLVVGSSAAQAESRSSGGGSEDGANGASEGVVQATIADDERGPLRRSLDRAQMALRGFSLTIDARSLTAAMGGTQTYVVGLILALAHERRAAVRVLVAPDIAPSTVAVLAAAPEVELLSYEDALKDPPLTDVVHRPQQVFTPEDLALLRLVGRRIVIGQQDLIAYHNYTYHQDVDAWRAYRRATRLSMAVADQVIFFSEHGRRDALAEDLLPPQRAHVVGIGAAALGPSEHDLAAPAGLSIECPFLLCLGADYAHKNRPFAIELLRALRAIGWDGRLVLAGAHVPHGSSRECERELLAEDPVLADSVIELGPVEEAGKLWLYAHAAALLYPTLFEGFGLIPLEAALMGLPCLFAAQASLAEVAPDAAKLVPWDPRASALAVLPLLGDGVERDEHVRMLRDLANPSWDEVARELLAVYECALASPAPRGAPRAWLELDRENYIVKLDRDMGHLKAIAQEYQDLYNSLSDRVGFGLSLIDKDGLLNRNQQRALMRIASRGRLGAAMLSPLDLLGRGDGNASS